MNTYMPKPESLTLPSLPADFFSSPEKKVHPGILKVPKIVSEQKAEGLEGQPLSSRKGQVRFSQDVMNRYFLEHPFPLNDSSDFGRYKEAGLTKESIEAILNRRRSEPGWNTETYLSAISAIVLLGKLGETNAFVLAQVRPVGCIGYFDLLNYFTQAWYRPSALIRFKLPTLEAMQRNIEWASLEINDASIKLMRHSLENEGVSPDWVRQAVKQRLQPLINRRTGRTNKLPLEISGRLVRPGLLDEINKAIKEMKKLIEDLG